MKLRHLLLGRKAITNLDSILKSRHYFANKGLSSQSYGFSSSHVWMWELDYKESWAQKNGCIWTMVLEKTLERPLNCKIKPINPKGNQSWIFIGRTDAKAPILWPPTWCKELTHWIRPWCWERLKAGGEAGDRGWDGWRASPNRWTWVWASSRSWWWTGKPGVLQSMESQSWTQLSDWTEDWFVWSCSPRTSGVFSSTSLKASILWLSAFFTVQFSQPYMTSGKTVVLTIQTFVSRVMSLLFNSLGLSLLSCQEAIDFWFHGCSNHPQWLWCPRRGNAITTSIFSPFICHARWRWMPGS